MPESPDQQVKARDHQMVRLPNDLHAELKERARAEDLSLSQALRRAVRAYLRERPTATV
jgi:hypothetical protein